MDVVMYALGGGFGHAVRACGLAQALARRGTRATVLLPAAKVSVAHHLQVSAWPIARTDDPVALRAELERALRSLAPAHLVMDALPTGVLGELSSLPEVPRRTLLLRLHTALDLTRLRAFDDVIDLEAHLSWLPRGSAAPFSAVALARDVASPAVDVALLPGSDPKLRAFCERLAERLRARSCTVQLDDGGDPPLSVHGAPLSAHVVVGAAGYNLTYEAARARVWHVAIPRSRAFDDQRRRARAVAELAEGPHDVEDRVRACLERDRRPRTVDVAPFDDLAERVLR